MSCYDEDRKITGVTMRHISNNQQQTVVSFRAKLETKEDDLEEIYKTIVGKILNGRDVIVVTKKEQLMELISDAVEATDQNYVSDNSEVTTFTPPSASGVEHHATLVKKIPPSVARDLATSTEFIYGNLWFLIACDADINECIEDVSKLTPSAFNELPVLRHETVAAPAMYDGLEILWFKPNEDVYQKGVKPLFEN